MTYTHLHSALRSALRAANRAATSTMMAFLFSIVLVGCSLDGHAGGEDEYREAVLSPTKAPGENFDLQPYKLQLPAASGSGVLEIKQPKLATYTSEYFATGLDGAMVFLAPVTGASTSGSKYARSELRDLREWDLAGTHRQSGQLVVLQQPSNGKLIFAQIHGHVSGSEALKLRWTNGNILAGTKSSLGASESKQTIVSGVQLGEPINYIIEQADHVITITVNGHSVTHTLDATWDVDTYYFKAGAYTEDNEGPSSEAGKVAYYELSGVVNVEDDEEGGDQQQDAGPGADACGQ